MVLHGLHTPKTIPCHQCRPAGVYREMRLTPIICSVGKDIPLISAIINCSRPCRTLYSSQQVVLHSLCCCPNLVRAHQLSFLNSAVSEPWCLRKLDCLNKSSNLPLFLGKSAGDEVVDQVVHSKKKVIQRIVDVTFKNF